MLLRKISNQIKIETFKDQGRRKVGWGEETYLMEYGRNEEGNYNSNSLN
jgi:hypothetical protein